MLKRLFICLLLVLAFSGSTYSQDSGNEYDSADTSSDSVYVNDEFDLMYYLLLEDTSSTAFDDTSITLEQGRSLLGRAEYDSAIWALNDYIYYDSLNNEAWYLLGFAYDQMDNMPLGAKYYRKSIEVDSTYWGPYRDLAYQFDIFVKYDSMNCYMRKAIELAPNPDSLYFDFAYSFDMQGNGDSAIAYYHKSLEKFPRDIDAYLNIGAIWGANGGIDSAKVYTQKALDLDPGYSRCNYNYAEILSTEGNSPKAIDYFQKALALDTNMIEAKLRLGELYESLGDSAMAMMYYREFVDSAPPLYFDDINRTKVKLQNWR